MFRYSRLRACCDAAIHELESDCDIVVSPQQARSLLYTQHENAVSLEVREKRLGWYLENHHGDGRLAINCKAARGIAQQLEQHAPERFHIPKHMGRLGWVGLWLDTPQVDWTEVKAILVNAYRLTAPKQLLAKLDQEPK